MTQNCRTPKDLPDRGSYRIKWIIQTTLVVSIIYFILWYFFPRYEVVEKKVYIPPLKELVCDSEQIIEYVPVPCHAITK